MALFPVFEKFKDPEFTILNFEKMAWPKWLFSLLILIDKFDFIQDRYSYFNQVIIAKRFTPELSLQVAPSISHFNAVDAGTKNDMIAIAFGGRYKISPHFKCLFNPSFKFFRIFLGKIIIIRI